MSSRRVAELDVEQAALAWLAGSGFAVAHGPAIAVGQPGSERSDPTYRDVVLERRLREAQVRLNPDLPQEALVSDGAEARIGVLGADGHHLSATRGTLGVTFIADASSNTRGRQAA